MNDHVAPVFQDILARAAEIPGRAAAMTDDAYPAPLSIGGVFPPVLMTPERQAEDLKTTRKGIDHSV